MNSIPAGTQPANPARRVLLGTLGIAPAAAFAVAPALASAGTEPGLLAAMNTQRQAEAAHGAYVEQVQEPATDAWNAAQARVPHVRTISTFRNVLGNEVTLSTERSSVAQARCTVKDARHVGADYLATAREAIGLAETREAELHRLRVLHRVDDIETRQAELADASWDALMVVARWPVSSLADLRAKAEFLAAGAAWDLPEASEAVLADVRRLAGGVA